MAFKLDISGVNGGIHVVRNCVCVQLVCKCCIVKYGAKGFQVEFRKPLIVIEPWRY